MRAGILISDSYSTASPRTSQSRPSWVVLDMYNKRAEELVGEGGAGSECSKIEIEAFRAAGSDRHVTG